MRKHISVLAAVLIAGAAVLAANASDATAARFDKLKALAGDWTKNGGDGTIDVSYRVTAAGTAVIETLLPGTPHEMVTVYTVDKGDLVLTHYCAQGNQPRMRATGAGTADAIEFKFDGGGNLKSSKDGHMHELNFAFVDADHIKTAWQYYQDGKPGEKAEFDLVRKKS
jgi:hypothetical protein